MTQAVIQPESPKAADLVNGAELPFRRSVLGRIVYQLLGRWGARLGLLWMLIVAFFAVFAPFLANSHPILFKADSQWSSPLLKHLTPVDVILVVFSIAVILLFFLKKMSFGNRCAIATWVLAAIIPFACWGEFVRSFPDFFSALGQAFWHVVIFLKFWQWFSHDWEYWWGLLTAICWLIALAVPLIVYLLALVGIPLKSAASMRAKIVTVCLLLPIAMLLVVYPVQPPRAVVMSQYREALASGEAEVAIYTLIPYSPTDRMRDLPDARLLAPGTYPKQQVLNDDGKPKYPEHWTQKATPNEVYGARMHLMGTTAYGEDLASRMIHASRIALSIGFIATGIALFLGVVIGALMGYFSGLVDLIGMRLVEVFSSIPTIYLLIAVVAFYGRNLYLMMVIIGLTGWVGYAMFTRAEFLKLRQMDYVQAARACGLPLWSVLFKHMLPNGVAPVLVSASFGIAAAILTEATLSFLGLGLVDEPSWGQMLNQARGLGGSFFWWIAIYPGGAIFLTVFAYNLVGEALRDAIDPYAQKPGT